MLRWAAYGMDMVVWILTGLLLLAGLVGSVAPVLPGAALIVLGVALHQALLPEGESVGWGIVLILLVLAALSAGVDFVAGSLGAKRFGASKWGAWGGLAGAVIGLFFGLPGLLLGPVIGVVAAELVIAQKQLPAAARAGWGTIVGGLLGALGKLVIAVVMVGIFWGALLWR